MYTQWPNNGPAMNDLFQTAVDVFTIAVGGQSLDYKSNLEKWYGEMGLTDIKSEVYTIGLGKKATSPRMASISSESLLATSKSLSETAKGESPFYQTSSKKKRR